MIVLSFGLSRRVPQQSGRKSLSMAFATDTAERRAFLNEGRRQSCYAMAGNKTEARGPWRHARL